MYWLLVPSLQIQTLELNMKIMRNAPNPYNRKVAKTDYNRSFYIRIPGTAISQRMTQKLTDACLLALACS